MTVDPEVYYSCSDCVVSFVKEASNGVYVEATTDHARCSKGCRSKATFVCRVYPDEPESVLKEEPEESCKACCQHDGDGGYPLQGSQGRYAGFSL